MWEAFERAAKTEAAKWSEVSQATRLDYEAKAKRLEAPGGYAFHAVAPATRKIYKAAGLWVMRKRLKAILKDARKLKKDGLKGDEMFALRQMMWATKLDEARELVAAIDVLHAVQCQASLAERKALSPNGYNKRLPMAEADYVRAQASHKQKPATDDDLEKFHAWAAKNSSFAEVFLVAEFTGCRGQDLAKGVRIETLSIGGVVTLRFHVEPAKCDGGKKGLDIRAHDIPFPSKASKSVKARWRALAEKATAKGGIVVKLEAKGKSTAGRRFTEACRTVSEGAGVKIGAYSLRHRFSSQVKAASKGMPDAAVNVALALGHQTTNTQRHYARAHRGGKGVSPLAIKGINAMGVQIRGPSTRNGPPQHVKDRKALSDLLPSPPPSIIPSAPKGLRL